ncbi:MAG TPA: outer membrane protein assembly factor BamE [Stellaceae bacterium]|jgi:outer membrane protein assembly factor BamE (lipoprotein component of BamABCDE complex)|nr:outer membrane protein assembly factor BamE [Stellaceae bacterium]
MKIEEGMQANQLEPAVNRVRDAKFAEEDRLPRLLDDVSISGFGRVADRFAPRKGDHDEPRAPGTGDVDNPLAGAEAVGLNWVRRIRMSTQRARRLPRRNSRAMTASRRFSLTTRRSSLIVAISASAALSACATTVEQRGNLPPPEKVAQIHPGKTTKDDVVKILGTPSSVGVFNDKNWYYISSRTGQFSFFDPKVLDQQVFVVDFNDDGIVKAVDHKTLVDGKEVVPVARATPAPGRELSFLEQLVGNLGKFNSTGGGGGEGAASSEGRAPGPNPYSNE